MSRFTSLVQKIQAHWLILVSALVLTLIIFYPVFALPQYLKGEYQGINFVHFGSDSHFYLTRAKEALEGKPMGNPFLREGKTELDLFFMHNEQILTAPWRWLGLSDSVNIVHIYNAYNFIGIFAVLILIYSLAFFLSKNKLQSAITAISVVGGYHLVYDKAFFYNDFNIYGRPMFPYISSLVFFTYLNVLVRALKYLNQKYFFALSLVFGAIFYVYFFAWTFAVAVHGSLFLLYAAQRDWKRVKFLLGTGVMGVILGSYQLITMAKFFTSPFGAQSEYFHWSAKGRGLIFSKIGFLSLIVLVILRYKKKEDQNFIFLLGLIAAVWVALNQQIITGKLLQIGHYYWYFIVPCAIITAWYVVWQFVQNKKWQIAITAFTLVVVGAHSLIGQHQSFLTTLDQLRYEQTYKPMLDILNQDQNPGVVLAADDYLSGLVTVYTNHDLFWDRSALMTYTSTERFRDVLYLFTYVNNDARFNFADYYGRVMADGAAESFYKQQYKALEGLASGVDYYSYNGKLAKQAPELISQRQKQLPELASEYKARASTPALSRDLFKQYHINYIIWDKKNHPEWDLSFLTNKKELYSTEAVVLYQVTQI